MAKWFWRSHEMVSQTCGGIFQVLYKDFFHIHTFYKSQKYCFFVLHQNCNGFAAIDLSPEETQLLNSDIRGYLRFLLP